MGPLFTFLCCLKRKYPVIYKDLSKDLVARVMLLEQPEEVYFNENINIPIKAKRMLFLIKYVIKDPSINSNFPIRWASRNNYIETVKDLLKNPLVDPSDSGCDAIISAAFFDHFEIVKILLEDKRTIITKQTISYATWDGNIEFVNLLLDKNNLTFTQEEIKQLAKCDADSQEMELFWENYPNKKIKV